MAQMTDLFMQLNDRYPDDDQGTRTREVLSVFHAVRRYSRALEEPDRRDRIRGTVICLAFLMLFVVALILRVSHF